MIKRLLYISLGLLLIPVVVAVSISLFSQIAQIESASNRQINFLFGIGAYLLIHIALHRPLYLYVVGHELTHAVAARLSGGRVRAIRASSKGGKVVLNKSNTLISLAPYCFPIYTILLALIYFGLSFFHPLTAYTSIFIFLVGFTLAFHLIMTIEILHERQPDILETGYLFSIAVIYIVNVAILTFILSLVFSGVSFMAFSRYSYCLSSGVYKAIFRRLFL